MPKLNPSEWIASAGAVIAILFSLGGVVAVSARNDTLLGEANKRIERVEAETNRQDAKINAIREDLADIKADVRWIKQTLGGSK